MNSGFANELVVQAEASFRGTLSGSAYSLPGRVGFTYGPQFEGGRGSVSMFRTHDGDSHAGRFFSGALDLEYAHNEATALLIASLMRRSGTTPNYTYSGSQLADRQSLALSLHYQPNDVYIVMRGVVIEAMHLALRWHEIIRVRFEWKAAELLTDAPISASSSPASQPLAGQIGLVTYEGVARETAYEGSIQIANRVDFVNYDEDKIAADYSPVGGLELSPEFAEWMLADAGADEVPSDVREQAEVEQQVEFVPAPGKLFRIQADRTIVRSGTPVGFQWGGIGYRAGAEVQAGEAATDWPVLTLTL